MTGPLAPLFAQVREALPLVGFAKTRDERTEAFEEVAAALSAIERHVQDMERARDWYRDHRSDGFYDEQMWGDPFAISPELRKALSPAALPAREEGAETNE